MADRKNTNIPNLIPTIGKKVFYLILNRTSWSQAGFQFKSEVISNFCSRSASARRNKQLTICQIRRVHTEIVERLTTDVSPFLDFATVAIFQNNFLCALWKLLKHRKYLGQ